MTPAAALGGPSGLPNILTVNSLRVFNLNHNKIHQLIYSLGVLKMFCINPRRGVFNKTSKNFLELIILPLRHLMPPSLSEIADFCILHLWKILIS